MNPNRKQKIEALTLARAIVGKRSYKSGICYALRRVMDTNPRLKGACSYLIGYISRALGNSAYLEGWLYRKVTDTYLYSPKARPKVNRTRLAWIDWMIACYEEDIRNGKT